MISKLKCSGDPNLIVAQAFGKLFQKDKHQQVKESKEFARKRCDQTISACLNKHNFLIKFKDALNVSDLNQMINYLINIQMKQVVWLYQPQK